jgi:hypothetical protein
MMCSPLLLLPVVVVLLALAELGLLSASAGGLNPPVVPRAAAGESGELRSNASASFNVGNVVLTAAGANIDGRSVDGLVMQPPPIPMPLT